MLIPLLSSARRNKDLTLEGTHMFVLEDLC